LSETDGYGLPPDKPLGVPLVDSLLLKEDYSFFLPIECQTIRLGISAKSNGRGPKGRYSTFFTPIWIWPSHG